MSTTDGERRRVYDEQILHLTSILGETTANIQNLDKRLNELNVRLNSLDNKLGGICKDCEPAKFVKAVEKQKYMVYSTIVALIITTIFNWVTTH